MRLRYAICGAIFTICVSALLMRPAYPQATVGIGAIGDPCLDSRIPKASKSLTIAAAATTAVTAVVGNTQTYVCGFTLVNGASQVLTFEQGTGASCAANVVALSGAMTVSATAGAVLQSGSGNGTVFTAGPGTGLCLVTGAAVAANGFVTFVQQ